MKSDNDILNQIELLDHYRQKAKQVIDTSAPDSAEYQRASKEYLNFNGAIDALNWVVGQGNCI